MSNEDQQNQSTEFESEMISEEPPSFEEKLDVLDKVFNKNFDVIDAAVLLAEAEIDLSIILSRAGLRSRSRQRLKESHAILGRKLENLSEFELMSLSDTEITCYLEAENIDCDVFLCQLVDRIESRTCLAN
jgi:hypothetical protein